MDNITYIFKKTKILTDPSITSHENVISKVYWTFIFTDGLTESVASGVTDLNTSLLDNFVEIQNVTDDILKGWIISAHGGENFISMLKTIHAPIIAKKTAESKLVVFFEDSNVSSHPYTV